jgi:hypothetical protein
MARESIHQVHSFNSFMKILMLTDNFNRAANFKKKLKSKNRFLCITYSIEACLKLYQSESQEVFFTTDPVDHIQPFDAVVLECESCGPRVVEVAKEILAVNPRQRIVLSLKTKSREAVAQDFAEQANDFLYVVQGPIAIQGLVDIVELKDVYSKLQKMSVDTDAIKRANFRHEQIINILNIVTGSKAPKY